MLWTEVQKDWKTYKPKFQIKWNKLTEADLTAIAGKREELVTRLMKIYKLDKPKIEKDIDQFLTTLTKPAKV